MLDHQSSPACSILTKVIIRFATMYRMSICDFVGNQLTENRNILIAHLALVALVDCRLL